MRETIVVKPRDTSVVALYDSLKSNNYYLSWSICHPLFKIQQALFLVANYIIYTHTENLENREKRI